MVAPSPDQPQQWWVTGRGRHRHLLVDSVGEHTSVDELRTSLCNLSAAAGLWVRAEDDYEQAMTSIPCKDCLDIAKSGLNWERMVQDSGVTYRQLDYWTRKRYLVSDNPGGGSGTRRTWPPAERDIATLMVELVGAGFKVEAAHKIARHGGLLGEKFRLVRVGSSDAQAEEDDHG